MCRKEQLNLKKLCGKLLNLYRLVGKLLKNEENVGTAPQFDKNYRINCKT